MKDKRYSETVSNKREMLEEERLLALDSYCILQGIISNMPVIIFKLDSKGIFTESRGAGLKIMGLHENEIVGSNVFELYPEMTHYVQEAYRGIPVKAILKGVLEEKEWYFECNVFVDSASNGGLVGFALDLTDRKIYEVHQEEYASKLEKVNRELDQFAYVVSHDLKAPLRAINNLSEWIEEDMGVLLNEHKDVKENMRLLRGRVNRMHLLIDGILEYSKAGRSQIVYEKVNVESLVNGVVEALGISDTFSISKQLPPVAIVANKVRLEQVFSNLLSNAIKYHDKDMGEISISYKENEAFHEFCVADNGPGIDPEYHEKIFLIFQTLQPKDTIESTGVGLSIVKKIIEEQGGTIRLVSELGKGAEFIFTLPRIQAQI